MMTSAELLIAASALLGLVVLSVTLLTGWQGWLAFKNRELDLRRGGSGHAAGTDPERGNREGAARIELADLKERVRKLEAIASGVDL